jgi:prophage tail gpP-like protein
MMLPFMAASSIPWGKIILAVVILGLGAAVFWYRHEAAVARDAQAVAERSAEIAAADAARWQAAAEERGRLIESQNAEIEAARADLVRARKVIADAAAAARQAEQAAEAEISRWKARAHANPDQTVPLGPISRDAVRLLLEP